MAAMIDYMLLLVALLGATIRARGDLVAENLLLRQQLAVLTRPTRKRPRLRAHDRLFWVVARMIRRDWRRHLALVTPETVVRWHRRGWRLFWRWRSRARAGQPRLSAEVRELIARIARENPSWGAAQGETENCLVAPV
jgi:hypothetical protein